MGDGSAAVCCRILGPTICYANTDVDTPAPYEYSRLCQKKRFSVVEREFLFASCMVVLIAELLIITIDAMVDL